MAFCRVVFPLLVLSVISCYASEVPVFLWGDSLKSSDKSNPLMTYSSEEFAGIFKQVLVEDPLTIVFIEETLSVEDFSLKNLDGETSYPYLHSNIGEAVYLPSVEDALPTLNRTAGANAVNYVLGINGVSGDLIPLEGRFVFINLNDAKEGESRADMLRRHNDFMEDTITKMQERDAKMNLVAVYTALYPSWTIPVSKSRVRRAVEGARNSRAYTLDGLRLTTANIVVKADNNSRSLGDVTAQSSVINETYVNATLTFDNTTLILNFHSTAGYWFFDTVVLTIGAVTDILYPSDEGVFAILGFSYRCAQYVTFNSVNETKTYSISFEDMKVQPYFETNTTQEFGDSFYCVGFFSAPILAGLMVVFILLAITFYGIMMMLDIRTMDRFDDPKGKTITINAGE